MKGDILVKDLTKAIVGGLTLVGLAVLGYKTYTIKKLQKELEEEQEVIEIESEKVE